MSELKTMAVALLILAILGSIKFTSSTPSTASPQRPQMAHASIDTFDLTIASRPLATERYQAH